jgi:hypothetical protein
MTSQDKRSGHAAELRRQSCLPRRDERYCPGQAGGEELNHAST